MFYILNSKKRDIPWSFINIFKLFFNCVLIVLCISDFGVAIHRISKEEEVFNVDIYTPLIKFLTFVSIKLFVFNSVIVFYLIRP